MGSVRIWVNNGDVYRSTWIRRGPHNKKKADPGKQAVRGISLLSQQCTGDTGYKRSIIIPEQKDGQCLDAGVRNSRNPGKTSK